MLEEVRRKLEAEVDQLAHELNVILPGEIERAVDQGDLRENSEYSAALERQRFVQVRLYYLARRLSELASLALEHVPTDRIGFGSRITIRATSNGEIEEYLLTLGEHLDFDGDEISMESPLGRALLGRRPGELVTVRLPAGSREYEILKLATLHDLAEDEAE